MDTKIWATTDSYGLFHAFNDEGRALCRRTIRPRSDHRITREKIADYPLITPCERCTAKANALAVEDQAAEQVAPEGEQATTYAVRDAALKTTGHYRRPGTRELFCGRPAGGRNGIFASVSGWHLCKRCVTAEARDRAEAAVVADSHRVAPVATAAGRDEPSDWWTIMDPATGEEVARVYGETYQEMTPRAEALPEVRAVMRRHKGFSRRRLYVSELTPAQRAEQAAPVEGDDQAAAEPSFETLALTVACPTCHVAAGARCVTKASKPAREPHGRRFEAVEDAAGITEHRAAERLAAEARGGWVACLDRKAEGDLLTAYAARVAAAAEARLDQVEAEAAEEFRRTARAVDAVEYAEQAEAAVETVEDAEALYAAQLVTEAEATGGTWQGAWIGQDAAEALFERATDQGALFS